MRDWPWEDSERNLRLLILVDWDRVMDCGRMGYLLEYRFYREQHQR